MRFIVLSIGFMVAPSLNCKAQDRIWYADGAALYDDFGWDLDVLPDLDADGVPELLIGARGHSCGGFRDGTAYEFSGVGVELDHWCGDKEYLGWSVAALGDVDQDGVGDIAVGAPWYWDPVKGKDTGRAFVISTETGATLLELNGEIQYNEFGKQLAGISDLDGDGYPELLVGAPGHGPGGEGAVYVISTRDGSTLRVHYGVDSQDYLGMSVAALGDVDGDGVKDYAAAAERYIDTRRGRLYVYSGQTGAELWTADGIWDYDTFGIAIADGGDIDGDGAADVLCSGDGADYTDYGHLDGYSGPTGTRLFRINTDVGSDQFARSFAPVGDANGDGVGDYLIGAPLDGHKGTNAGRAVLYSGKTLRSLYKFYPGYKNGRFGSAVHGISDVNGDGIDDFVISAPWARAASPQGGRVLVFAGNDLYLQPDIKDPSPGDFVTFDIRGGEPGAFAELVLIDISGTPMFEPLVLDFLDVNGELSSTLCVPDAAAGLDFTFIAYARKNDRKPRWVDSSKPVISVQ